MSSRENRIAALYEGKSSPIDLRDVDQDFAACIKARSMMTHPCTFLQGGFVSDYPENWDGRACWAGHLIMNMRPGDKSVVWASPSLWALWIDKVSRKLGFNDASGIYRFNDFNSHAEVLAEFDRRLQEEWK